MDHLGLQAIRDRQDHWDNQDPKGHQDCKDNLDHLELQVQLEGLVQ